LACKSRVCADKAGGLSERRKSRLHRESRVEQGDGADAIGPVAHRAGFCTLTGTENAAADVWLLPISSSSSGVTPATAPARARRVEADAGRAIRIPARNNSARVQTGFGLAELLLWSVSTRGAADDVPRSANRVFRSGRLHWPPLPVTQQRTATPVTGVGWSAAAGARFCGRGPSVSCDSVDRPRSRGPGTRCGRLWAAA
jgi:hypothetical protein